MSALSFANVLEYFSEVPHFEVVSSWVGPVSGVQVRFSNGYGASVIQGEGTYGGSKGLFELAVLDRNGDIDSTTPVTSDVLGWLTPEMVLNAFKDIAALP
jgi:hypothetical protein